MIRQNKSRMKQQFGGSLLYRKRKSKRPLDFKKSTHLVLRLNERVPSFFNPRNRKLRKVILEVAAKYEIRVYQLILNHTHCHSVIKLPSRNAYVKFIREVTSKLVKFFSDEVGVTLKKIFEWRPWTRFVEWGQDFVNIQNYMIKNQLESGVLQISTGRNSGRRNRRIKRGASHQQKQLSLIHVDPAVSEGSMK